MEPLVVDVHTLVDNMNRAAADTGTLNLANVCPSLSSHDVKNIANILDHKSTLRSLDISGSPIGEKGAAALAQSAHLTSLVAAGCVIPTAGVVALSRNLVLKSLCLTENEIDDDAVLMLALNTVLTSLVLSDNKISARGAQFLALNATLTSLSLNNNMLMTSGAEALAKNSHLVTLRVSSNFIGKSGFAALAGIPTLEHLEISYNQLTDEGMHLVISHSMLTRLEVSGNHIGPGGAKAISRHPTLLSLYISHNHLGNKGACELASSKTLTYLDASSNKIGTKGALALAGNHTLTALILSSNQVGDAGAIALAKNTNFSRLVLSYNDISDVAAIALAGNSTLKSLILNYNRIEENGKRALYSNTTLTSLNVSPQLPPEFTAENLDLIFLLSESFLCISGSTGTIQFFNPSFSHTLGYTADELLGHPILDFLHPADQTIMQQRILSQTDTIALHYETRLLTKEGATRVLRWSSQYRSHRMYAIGSDVTAERRAQQASLLTQNQRITDRLQAAGEFHSQKMEFVARLSHEIRNPLGGMQGLKEQLEDQLTALEAAVGPSDFAKKEQVVLALAAMRTVVADMNACIVHQITVLDDNLDLASIAEKKMVLRMRPFELTSLITKAVDKMRALASKKGLFIRLHLPDNVLVKGDEVRISQILINLLSNAIKFTQKGGIDISLEVLERIPLSVNVEVSVSDTGFGLAPEEVGILFRRFSQANISIGSDYGGSGLGLHLAQQLATYMGGCITVKSELGIGTTFTLHLQFEKCPELIVEKLQETPAVLAVEDFVASAQKVLIVDDNSINRKLLEVSLSAVGYQCKTAVNGVEAVSAWRNEPFDAILMDVVMPEMDGIVATRTIRQQEQIEKVTRIPIIGITANALERDRLEGLNAGMDDYITKPFHRSEICEKIAAAVNRERGLRSISTLP